MTGTKPTPTPSRPASRELYTVYVTEPTGRTETLLARSHDTLASALVDAAAKLAEYPGWSVEIVHRLHTITELSRIRVPTEEWLRTRLRDEMAERVHPVESVRARHPAPARRIAPLF